jgi:alpha-aminoadipate carrier protein LysW
MTTRRGETTSMLVTCPECAAEFELTGVEKGEIVQCPECGVELEVISEDPIELALAPEEEEDWGE